MYAVTSNTPDVMVLVPDEAPEEHTRVKTREDIAYWFHGPFLTEGPTSETRMHEVREWWPARYVEQGWWEKTTVSTTRVSERVEF